MKTRGRKLLFLTLAAVGVAAVASPRKKKSRPGGSSGGTQGGGSSPPPTPGGGWVDADAPRRIRLIAAPLASAMGWPDLPDFLVAIAWTESRGNPKSQAGSSANSARGWFQLRPKSARVSELGMTAADLKNERAAVALAAWYLYRLRNYAFTGQKLNLLALRRGMAYPFLVADVDEVMPTDDAGPGVRSRAARERFAEGIAKAGLAPNFMFHSALPPGTWPGIDQALALVGYGATS